MGERDELFAVLALDRATVDVRCFPLLWTCRQPRLPRLLPLYFAAYVHKKPRRVPVLRLKT